MENRKFCVFYGCVGSLRKIMLLFRLLFFCMCLVWKTANAGRPPIGFCIELLLGSKYERASGVVLGRDYSPLIYSFFI
jgi:hypothetical protein